MMSYYSTYACLYSYVVLFNIKLSVKTMCRIIQHRLFAAFLMSNYSTFTINFSLLPKNGQKFALEISSGTRFQ